MYAGVISTRWQNRGLQPSCPQRNTNQERRILSRELQNPGERLRHLGGVQKWEKMPWGGQEGQFHFICSTSPTRPHSIVLGEIPFPGHFHGEKDWSGCPASHQACSSESQHHARPCRPRLSACSRGLRIHVCSHGPGLQTHPRLAPGHLDARLVARKQAHLHMDSGTRPTHLQGPEAGPPRISGQAEWRQAFLAEASLQRLEEMERWLLLKMCRQQYKATRITKNQGNRHHQRNKNKHQYLAPKTWRSAW